MHNSAKKKLFDNKLNKMKNLGKNFKKVIKINLAKDN